MAAKLKLEIEQRATFQHRLVWKGSNGKPIDLTNWSALIQVRKTYSNETIIIELSTANGRITLGGTAGTIDHVGNTLLGGSPGETISARAWRNRNKSRFWGLACKGIDRLFFFDDNHCEKSFQSILDRRHLPAEDQIE